MSSKTKTRPQSVGTIVHGAALKHEIPGFTAMAKGTRARMPFSVAEDLAIMHMSQLKCSWREVGRALGRSRDAVRVRRNVLLRARPARPPSEQPELVPEPYDILAEIAQVLDHPSAENEMLDWLCENL